MNDKELADKVMALGVCHTFEWGDVEGIYHQYWAPDGETSGMDADKFVRDWRVFGALSELCYERGVQVNGVWPVDALTGIEACVEALDSVLDRQKP